MSVVINNVEYSWGDISVVLLGRPVTGIRGVEYKAKQTKEALYASGREPRGIQRGKREYDASITLLQSELDALNVSAKAAGYKDALGINFDVVVSYISEAGVVTTDIIRNAEITELPKGMKQGDMQSEHTLPMIALKVDFNVI